MWPARSLLFPPFRLDPADERLWHGTEAIVLRHKTWAVLHYLVEHPGQLVTKEELLAAVWPKTVVGTWVLTDSVSELRKALGDDPGAPKFVETVYGRGYRFIAPVTTTPPVISRQFSVVRTDQTRAASRQLATGPQRGTGNWDLATGIVGREAELEQLHGWLTAALDGMHQLVFVTGEPGIGKTTLVEAFLQSLESRVQDRAAEVPSPKSQVPSPNRPPTPAFWIGRGQCIEHYSASEAYLPVLEA